MFQNTNQTHGECGPFGFANLTHLKQRKVVVSMLKCQFQFGLKEYFIDSAAVASGSHRTQESDDGGENDTES